MSKLLLLDLDGTIRKPKSDSKFINDPLDQELIFGADLAARRFLNEGWTIVGVSNQGGIEAGHKTIRSAIAEMRITLKLAPWLSRIYFCPNLSGKGDDCVVVKRPWWLPVFTTERINLLEPLEQPGRWSAGSDGFRKPNSGMLKLAIYDALDSTLTDHHDSLLMVGDREEDQAAAEAAWVAFHWADSWRSDWMKEQESDR